MTQSVLMKLCEAIGRVQELVLDGLFDCALFWFCFFVCHCFWTDNILGDEGTKILCRSLQSNTTLSLLSLGRLF